MTEVIRLPEISENVKSGDVIDVLVKVGDLIEQEQPIVELETEKATFEVPSPLKGKVVEISIKQGQTVNVGQTIIKVDTDPQAAEEAPASTAEPAPEKKEPAVVEKTVEKQPAPEVSPEIIEEKEPAATEKTTEKPPAPEVSQEGKKEEPVDEPEESETPEKEPEPQVGAVPAAPSARQLARELGIDLNSVTGTGPEGRISEMI